MNEVAGSTMETTAGTSTMETTAGTSRVVEFAIAGMTCAACSARLEKVLNRQAGIEANVNLAAERARVRLDGAANEAAVIAAVAKAGFTAGVVDKNTRALEKARRLADYQREIRRFWIAVDQDRHDPVIV